jgi:hypothetical protein
MELYQHPHSGPRILHRYRAMLAVSSVIHHENGVSDPLPHITARQDKRDVKFSAGTMGVCQFHHKGYEYTDTAIKQLEENRQLTGLTPLKATSGQQSSGSLLFAAG